MFKMLKKCLWADFPESPNKYKKHVSGAFKNVKNVFKMPLGHVWDMFFTFSQSNSTQKGGGGEAAAPALGSI